MKKALNVTILHPDKLTYRILFGMVQTFRAHQKQYPDLIEFTPELYKAFKERVFSEQRYVVKFLGIPVIIDPKTRRSHNALPDQPAVANG